MLFVEACASEQHVTFARVDHHSRTPHSHLVVALQDGSRSTGQAWLQQVQAVYDTINEMPVEADLVRVSVVQYSYDHCVELNLMPRTKQELLEGEN